MVFVVGLVACGAEEEPDITPDVGEDCTTLPAVQNYAEEGPFSDTNVVTDVGPNGNYTLYRPGKSLGYNGYQHPIVTWGNGILTNPGYYEKTLRLIASHGFVVIACNDIQAERDCLSDGLDWLVSQNSSGGELDGKLDVSRELTVGYSWGGGAAIDTADRPNVKATVSFHGMPPREDTAFESMHSPLLLFTSTGDDFVNAENYVTPNYDASLVQTFYATLLDDSIGHLYILDVSGEAALERGPAIAWMRYWACEDPNAKSLFFGDDCELCQDPWSAQKKYWTEY